MDFYEAIKDLYEERRRIDAAIATLERLRNGNGPPAVTGGSRRGRKGMSAEERKLVSERMRRYWESRRVKTTS